MLAVLALSAAAGCDNGPVAPQQTAVPLFVFADFSAPNVTVRVNNKVLGVLTQQFTATNTEADCQLLQAAAAEGTVLSTTIRLDQHYALGWDYGDGTSGSDEFDGTPDVIASTCLAEPIPAP